MLQTVLYRGTNARRLLLLSTQGQPLYSCSPPFGCRLLRLSAEGSASPQLPFTCLLLTSFPIAALYLAAAACCFLGAVASSTRYTRPRKLMPLWLDRDISQVREVE